MIRFSVSPLVRAVVLAAAAFLVFPSAASAAGKPPSVAVTAFDSEGLTSWWGSGFNPGAAIADVFGDRLVNSGNYTVVDRQHIDSTLAEHNLSASGLVSPDSQTRVGHLIGAGYLIVGRIVQFDHESHQGGNLGSLIGGNVLGGGSVGVNKMILKVSMKVVEVNTGRVVQAVESEKTNNSASFSLAAFTPGTGGSYDNEQFLSSSAGKLMTSVADDLIQKLDPSKMTATAVAAASIRGRILSVDGDDIVLNVGTAKGVQTGMYFDVVDVKQLKDPDSGKMITTEIPKGQIQVVSVSASSSIAKRVSGSARALMVVKSE